MNALSPPSSLLARLRRHEIASLWDVLEIKTSTLIEALYSLTRMLKELQKKDQSFLMESVPTDNMDDLRASLADLVASCEALGAMATREAAKELLADLNKPYVTFKWVHNSLLQIVPVLPREVGGNKVYCMTSQQAAFYEKGSFLFGEKFPEMFPSLVPEINDCAKCYSFERHTGCAFHALRCLESGIRAMSRCLQIPDPTRGVDRSWAFALKKIKTEIDRRWPKSEDRLSGDGQTFEDLHAALASMQNPWRNATMHLEARYSREDAESLVHVVRRFMSRLAERMDENGLPLA